MSRRKPAVIDDDFYEEKIASIEPLSLGALVLKVNALTSYVEQLNFKYVPSYSSGNNRMKKGTDYIPMGRESFVREVYRILKPDFNRTKKGYFDELKIYVRWLDENNLKPIEQDFFHPDLCKSYMTHHQEKVNRGDESKATWSSAKNMMSFFLKAKSRELEAKRLPSIKGIKRSTNSYKGIDVKDELRPLIKLFLSAFKEFRQHINEGTLPDVHPFWNKNTEKLFAQTAELEGWSARSTAHKKRAFVQSVVNKYGSNAVFNQFTRLAIMLTFCFTGQNTSPILKMRFGDIRFTAKSNGKVYFDMDKARANYLSFDTTLGFHTKVQEFFHQWLAISTKLQKDSGSDWLFPYFTESGNAISYIDAGRSPQEPVNKLTKSLGLAHITASISRQTKIDTLMKVTEDLWVVSMSANNSISVISAHYSHGNESDHRHSLAASQEAMYNFAKNGVDIHNAAKEAKFNFSNVLSDYDYKRLRREDKENDKQTPIGSRCMDSSQGAANTIKKNLEKEGVKQPNEITCTDFLSCFECTYHRLVAEIEDIWLMLSFSDTLKEMKDYPAINSLPTEKYYKLCNTVEAVLKRFKEVSPNNYANALEKSKNAPHPLYSDAYSLVDLLEVF
ncbi:hypothetical protein ACMAZD_15430 [Vibrio sp. nBUS_14]|uniref:hypothetical protein n=1 Tax=Vibrio sp. nBUS_14 TaxID=3395321 RepID=UPI003EB91DBF